MLVNTLQCTGLPQSRESAVPCNKASMPGPQSCRLMARIVAWHLSPFPSPPDSPLPLSSSATSSSSCTRPPSVHCAHSCRAFACAVTTVWNGPAHTAGALAAFPPTAWPVDCSEPQLPPTPILTVAWKRVRLSPVMSVDMSKALYSLQSTFSPLLTGFGNPLFFFF